MTTKSDSSHGALAGPGPRHELFATTHWSRVLAAAEEGENAIPALNSLCEQYWYPVYVFIRQRGYSPPDAQDLTQGFFSQILSSGTFAKADPSRGRLRSFLLGCLRHYLGHEWERVRASKRGGNIQFVPLNWPEAETRYSRSLKSAPNPNASFDRQWALALVGRVLDQLQAEYISEKKAELFSALKQTLSCAGRGMNYEVLAQKLKMSEGALKVAVHRLRQRYRKVLREEVARTVRESKEIEEEMRYLLIALSSDS